MERLLEMAAKVTDQSEIYFLEEVSEGIRFENAALKDIESASQSGMSLRLIRQGKAGFAYTRNLLNRQEVLQNGLDSLKGEVEAAFDFPVTKGLPALDTFDPSLEETNNGALVEECGRVCGYLSERTKGQINVSAWRKTGRIRLLNSRGTDLSSRFSFYLLSAEILYPGSHASIHRPFFSKKFERIPHAQLNEMLELFNRSLKEVSPKGGKMKVLFLPETLYALLWRIQSATNGKNVYQKTSPVMEKIGTRILSEKLSLYNAPTDDRLPGARAFDDEGIPCRNFSIIDSGTLAGFYFDLHYAGKLNVSPTGHGFKSALWGGETISLRPSPALEHLCLKPGQASFSGLLKSMDSGILAAGVIGAHSGNILNGDFSVGLSPGLYVERGEIVGHVKDAMIAGNVYQTLNGVIELEETLHPTYGGNFPAVLIDRASVAAKP